jgi:hypothetical protein
MLLMFMMGGFRIDISGLPTLIRGGGTINTPLKLFGYGWMFGIKISQLCCIL